MLFNSIIFGPIHSRRLGVSLGVNLLPADAKICSFNCIYCECGFNTALHDLPLPSAQDVKNSLENKLAQMRSAGEKLDVITFAGNGEPTLHPAFEQIIDDTVMLRNKYFPNAKVSVLSNSTQIDKAQIFRALQRVDNNIQKFDSAVERTVQLIDQPVNPHFSVQWQVENMKRFEGNVIIQTMFVKGTKDCETFDNTSDYEVEQWLAAMLEIRPRQIMIYSLDRATPVSTLQKIDKQILDNIAAKAREKGLDVMAV